MQFSDLIRKIQILNPDVQVDSSGRNIYFGGFDPERKTGLFYKGDHICNIDAGEIPEFTTYGGNQYNMFPVPPSYALAHRDTCLTIQILLEPENVVQLNTAAQALGDRKFGEIEFGGYQVMAEWVKGKTADGNFVQCILLRLYLARQLTPWQVDKIGWREICERLINFGVPGINRRSLGLALGVELTPEKAKLNSLADSIKRQIGV